MQTLTIISLVISSLAALAIFYFLFFNKSSRDLAQDKNLEDLKTELKDIREAVSSSFQKNLEFVQSRASESNRIIQDVSSKLTQLDATNKQVVGFATQLQSLENILKNPKQRGILGEYFLEALLGNILPPNNYKMQYAFNDGQIVDAAIFIKDKIIPVDAKFSLEKYNQIMETNDASRRDELEKDFKRDIKNRIDETAKYIRPNENTTDFAFMFIPAEGIYYNLLIYKVGNTNVSSQDLIQYAFGKKVIIVSPTSFFAYLQTVIQALKALKIEESVKDILKRVDNLSRHMLNYEQYMARLGNNLKTTQNAYDLANTELQKIDKDIAKLSGDGEKSIEAQEVFKPQIES
ncbi:MAG: DNA recombination protein RmuC [Patescibacteria group bacterium]